MATSAVAAACPAFRPIAGTRILYHRFPSLVPYRAGLQLQRDLVERNLSSPDTAPDLLLLLEHPPTYTNGRRHLNKGTEPPIPAKLGLAEYVETERGGEITFHGPGQLVGYPIINLKHYKGLSIRCFVSKMEQSIIDLCQNEYGITAQRTKNTGVWVVSDSSEQVKSENKIAAMGINVKRYVTSHGFAVNVSTDLAWFNHIVACGLVGKGVTSIENEVKRAITAKDVMVPMAQSFANALGAETVPLEDVDYELSSWLNERVQIAVEQDDDKLSVNAT
ncbi:lipoyltransferase [Ramicandelaber brevisporus]|nr:lipoyltransferase [Ramicandelaber brevisporus]